MATMDTLAKRSGICILATAPAHSDWRKDKAIVAAMNEADIVIVNGEGTIHHDRPAGEALLFAAEYAKQRGKASALVNATWDSNGENYARMARLFSLVSVRESSSAQAILAQGVTARVVPDLALYADSPVAPQRNGVAYTDSVIGADAIDIYRRMAKLGARPTSLLFGRKSARDAASSVRRFLQGRSAIGPSALAAAARGAVIDWTAQNSNRDEVLGLIASQTLVVTGRFHMVILCLAAGTPFLAVESNTHKISATLGDTGLESWRLIKPASLDHAMIGRAAKWHGDEHAKLEDFVRRSRAQMEQLFDDVSQLRVAA